MRYLAPIVAVLMLSGCPKNTDIIGHFNQPTGAYPVPRIGYKVYRGTSRTNMEPIFTVQQENFLDTSAESGVTYYYKVTAVYADGSESDPTNLACGTADTGQVQCSPP